ncbi:RagB/SusD family nutrient uptake outer membrane protein [Mucilaginibacter sp. RCC_168]|uniref:RagB/SusD family nutrient uptake outer membrane protein n=1 Tax=Mucilaginibacter sp. RCC_168 TaxID=3239221 RepID=UPI003523C5D4
MKKIHLKVIVPLVLVALCLAYSCKKNLLSQTPQGQLLPAQISNAAGVNGILIGAYSLLDGVGGIGGGSNASGSNWMFGSIAAGDAYKGSQPSDGGQDALPVGNFTANTSNVYVRDRYTLLFDGVARSNDVLRTIPLAKDLAASDAKTIAAEAKFLRGFYYLELRKMYGQVPYADETTTDYNLPNTAEIWPKIEADFKAAMADLPATQPQKGRANSWAAMAYLAKTYMFEHKYDDALPLFHQLISSGVTARGQKYALNPIFQTNFSPEGSQKNSAESVFAAQNSVNDGSNGQNGNAGDDLNFPYGGPGGCCGWFNPSQSLGNSFKTDANGLPLFDTFDTVGQDVSNGSTPWTGNVDPRLDITVGRPGIPFLDWGNPAPGWIRDPTDGVFNPRKNVYSQSEKGSNSDNTPGVWNNVQLTSNNINLMRYSDILLMAAEAEIEATTGGNPATALDDVNQVRTRAANPAGWVYKNSTYAPGTSTYTVNGTPADKYKVSPYPAGAFADKAYARKAIRFERKIELAMEGMRFFDLQRWDGTSVALPNGAATGDGSMAAEINAFFTYDVRINSQLQGAKFTKGVNEYYFIPQSQIDLSKSLAGGKGVLVQNKGY